MARREHGRIPKRAGISTRGTQPIPLQIFRSFNKMANAYDAQHHTTPHYTHGGWVGPFRALLCFLLANYTAVRTIEIGYHTIYDDWYSVQGISTC